MGQLCPLHPGQEGLPSLGLAHSGQHSPAPHVSSLASGRGRSRSLQHPEMSPPAALDELLVILLHLLPFASTAAAPRGDGPYPPWATWLQLATGGPSAPSKTPGQGFVGWEGTDRHQAPSLTEQGAGRTSPRSVHMTRIH